MVKQVKQSLELTDNFITERIEGGYPRQYLTSGYDLRDFVYDSQTRFTDELEELLVDVTQDVAENSKNIRDNEVANQEDHAKYKAQNTEHNIKILDNRTELNINRSRLNKLQQDDRVIGYYVNASQDLTLNTEGDFQSFLPPPGSYAIIDKDYNVITNNPEDTAFIVFNSEDLLGDRRTFLGVFSGDIIELSFVKPKINPDPNGQELLPEYTGRITFRVTLEYDAGTQLGSEVIKVDVAFVNTSLDELPLFDEVPEGLPIDYYSKVSVTPALVVDSLVDPYTLRQAVLPTGCIIPWASNNIPDGWLRCDGRNYQNMSQLTKTQKNALKNILKVDTLPPLAGRYVVAPKGNYTNTHVHNMNTLGGVYYAKTGAPTNNQGNTYNLSLASGGSHGHNANIGGAGNHVHKVGNDIYTCGRNAGTDVPGVNLTANSGVNHKIFTTDSVGDHSHTVDVSYHNQNHNHTLTGFNNESTRPHTVSMHYIIKYK